MHLISYKQQPRDRSGGAERDTDHDGASRRAFHHRRCQRQHLCRGEVRTLVSYLNMDIPYGSYCIYEISFNSLPPTHHRTNFAAARESHLPEALSMVHKTARTPVPAVISVVSYLELILNKHTINDCNPLNVQINHIPSWY